MTMRVYESEGAVSLEKQRELQFNFAMQGLQNSQDLVRFLDQKAGLVITAVSILTAAIGALLIEAIRGAPVGVFGLAIRGAIGVGVLLYMLLAFAVISWAIRVLMPAVNRLLPDSHALGLIFPLMVLQRTDADDAVYTRRVVQASIEDLIHDFANQILEVSYVYKEKHEQLGKVMRYFRWLSILWVLLMLLLSVSVALV